MLIAGKHLESVPDLLFLDVVLLSGEEEEELCGGGIRAADTCFRLPSPRRELGLSGGSGR